MPDSQHGFDKSGARRVVNAVRMSEAAHNTRPGGGPRPAGRMLYAVEVGLVTSSTDTGIDDANTNPVQWTYIIQPAYKSAAGYGSGGVSKWIEIPDVDGLVGYNFAEDLNDGTGTQGNGVDHDGTDYPSGFAMQPAVPNNTPVVFLRVPIEAEDGSVTVEGWIIQILNAEDGTCS